MVTTSSRLPLSQRLARWWAGPVWPRLQRLCPPAAVAARELPAGLQAAWQASAAQAWPGLRTDDEAWARCAVALAQFFEACRLQAAFGDCALPSRAADSVWHAALAADPAGFAAWQHRFFGREVAHRPHADLAGPLDDCLARTWAAACRSEGRRPTTPTLPLVFALDARLRLPGGFAYAHQRGAVVHRLIDGFGRPGREVHGHPALAAAGLAGLGLITAGEWDDWRRARDGGGGDAGSGAGSTDAGGCDAGDGGGGCGCGGGGGD